MNEQERKPLHLFDAFGVEMEYMIVDARTLDVRPITDELIRAACGKYEGEIERADGISWSNELALHVVELKTTEPARELGDLGARFAGSVREINALLGPMGARLMPTAMHPWMDPFKEMKLWPHEYSPVYEAFNRVFDCRGHGWANLQSTHVNLPFCGDEEFGRLHAAIRLILPILPALTAASPVMDGRVTGVLDNRLVVYRTNSAKIPRMTGRVIPEPVYTKAEYEERILRPLYEQLKPFDPQGELQDEWANARGAIARFDRDAIEIRVMDVQECPSADAAIVRGVVEVLRWMTREGCSPLRAQRGMEVEPLRRVLDRVTEDGERAMVENSEYLEVLGCGGSRMGAGDVWRTMLGKAGMDVEREVSLRMILDRGTLARRMVDRLGGRTDRGALRGLAGELCDCLAQDRMLGAERAS